MFLVIFLQVPRRKFWTNSALSCVHLLLQIYQTPYRSWSYSCQFVWNLTKSPSAMAYGLTNLWTYGKFVITQVFGRMWVYLLLYTMSSMGYSVPRTIMPFLMCKTRNTQVLVVRQRQNTSAGMCHCQNLAVNLQKFQGTSVLSLSYTSICVFLVLHIKKGMIVQET